MIPLNLEDQEVLRRTLEELERSIIVVATPISPVNRLDLGADLAAVIAKINELVDGHNATVAVLNSTNTTDRP